MRNNTVLGLKMGDRVRLESTDDPHTKLLPGAEGTVYDIDDGDTVHICWDAGSHLGMVVVDNPTFPRLPGEVLDRIVKIDGESRFCDHCQPLYGNEEQ